MKRRMFLTVITLSVLMALTAYADATFSQFWKQDGAGNWYVEQPGKGKVTNAWLCDDAVASNGKDVWYLLDANGNMVTAGLVQDGTGNFYSLETEEQKYDKMMHVIMDLGRSYGEMEKKPLTYKWLNDFLSKTDWPNMNTHDRVQAAFNAVCCDDNGYGKKGYNNGNYYKLATSAEVNSGEWGIPAYHHGTCKEYSETLKWLLELMEVSSELHQCQIEGKTHVAVRINIGGTTYQLDPTNPESKSAGFDANLRTLDDPVVLSMEW